MEILPSNPRIPKTNKVPHYLQALSKSKCLNDGVNERVYGSIGWLSDKTF